MRKQFNLFNLFFHIILVYLFDLLKNSEKTPVQGQWQKKKKNMNGEMYIVKQKIILFQKNCHL